MVSVPAHTRTRVGFMVHELAHAVAVRAASQRHGIPVTLVSAPGAAGTGGAGWWRAIITQAQHVVPEADATSILDCADAPGMALAAIREGVKAIALSAPAATLSKVRDIGAQSGVTLQTVDWDNVYDLIGTNDPRAECENHLLKRSGSVANPRALG